MRHSSEAEVAVAHTALAGMVAELLGGMGSHLQQLKQVRMVTMQLLQQQACLAAMQLAGQGGGGAGVTTVLLLLAAGEALAGDLGRLYQAEVGAEAEAGLILLPLLLLRRPGSRLLQPVQPQPRRH